MMRVPRRSAILGFVVVALILLPFYFFTLQTIPNGSDQLPMIDVGETQVVLNVWGTLHATGYPLYVLLSAALVTILKSLGMSAATAPAVTSLLWGMLALAVIYTLGLALTRRVLSAALMTILFGLTRMVWLHQTIAEIYTFGLLLTALLFLIALRKIPIRGRIYWLALLGGIGVGHHRAVIMLAPSLIYAVWPLLIEKRSLPRKLFVCLLFGLLGLLPYLYLPLRANANAAWVYGEPGTVAGLWDQFSGREASRFIGAPSSLLDNFNKVNTALLTDLALPGLVIGVAGFVLAVRTLRHRRAAITFGLAGVVSYGFHVLFYSDILAALILQITLSVAFGWMFVIDWLFVRALQSVGNFRYQAPMWVRAYVIGTVALLALLLIAQNVLWIRGLTHDTTGLRTIAIVEQAEAGSTLMLPWGTRHFAAGFARDVLNELPGVTLVDHKADLHAPLLTLADTFYTYPPSWWEERFNAPIHLRAAAPDLVEIATQSEIARDLPEGISLVEQNVTCTADQIALRIAWGTSDTPTYDLSVFVHLLDAEGNMLAQADQSAPVFGWRPLTTWHAGEIVRDAYSLPREPGAALIRYGLYRQLDKGAFQNEYEYEIKPTCD